MAEPPSKSSKRTAAAAGLADDGRPTSRPNSSGRDYKHSPRDNGDVPRRRHKPEDERRRRSRSRGTPEARKERNRSRERPYSGRDRDRDRDRRRDRDRGDRDSKVVNGSGRRERSRSRDRHRDSKDHRGDRSSRHSRSRSPPRNGASFVRTRSPLRRNDHDRDRKPERPARNDEERIPPATNMEKEEKVPSANKPAKPATNGDAMAVDEDSEDAFLRRMMGFTKFRTTHNTKVPGNQIYAVRKEKKTEYRQYMNRVGGFNRPLSPSR